VAEAEAEEERCTADWLRAAVELERVGVDSLRVLLITRFQKLFISADTPVFKPNSLGYFGRFWEILRENNRFSTTIS